MLENVVAGGGIRRGVLIFGASLEISIWRESIVSSEVGDPGAEEDSESESSLMCAAERTREGSASILYQKSYATELKEIKHTFDRTS